MQVQLPPGPLPPGGGSQSLGGGLHASLGGAQRPQAEAEQLRHPTLPRELVAEEMHALFPGVGRGKSIRRWLLDGNKEERIQARFHDRIELKDFLSEASDDFSHAIPVVGERDYVAKAIVERRPWPHCREVLDACYALFTTTPITAVAIYCMYCTYMELAGLGDVFKGSMAAQRLARRALYFNGFNRLQWSPEVAARLTADWETGKMLWEEGGLQRCNPLLKKAEDIVPMHDD